MDRASIFAGLFICALLFLVAFYLYIKKREKARWNGLIEVIDRINRADYEIDFNTMQEGEYAILKDRLYKMSIMLREQAENSRKDKEEIKDALSDISHQLKTPFTSILIMTDALTDDPDMDEAMRTELLRDIKREVEHVNFLVQNLLKLSRFDANSVIFYPKEHTLGELVDKAVQNVSALIDLKSVRIIRKGDDTGTFMTDINWQAQALTNVLKNGLEHSREGSRIHIYTEKNTAYCMVRVTDEAGGIPDEDIPHIFERFYKGKNSGDNSTGIGLSLAKTIVNKEGGTLTAHSEGAGSVFEFKYFACTNHLQQSRV